MSWDKKSPKMWACNICSKQAKWKFGRGTYPKPPNYHGSWSCCGEVQQAAVMGIKATKQREELKQHCQNYHYSL